MARSSGRCFQGMEAQEEPGLFDQTVHQEALWSLNEENEAPGQEQRCRKSPPLGWLPCHVSHVGIPHQIFLEQYSLKFIRKIKNASERSTHLSPCVFDLVFLKG